MRDIKFRAWDKVHKKMIKPSGSYGSMKHWRIEGANNGYWGMFEGKRLCGNADDSGIMMQYTGRTDKNGVEIYEGDLIPYMFNAKKLGVVKYGEYQNICDDEFSGHIGFYVEWQDKQLRSMNRKDLGYWIKVSSVVGNIYENPEQLSIPR